jgi:Flp pilus assembly protein TadG
LPENQTGIGITMRNSLRLIGRFRRDQRGNIAVIFAITCVPLISAIGCAVDYTRIMQIQSKLQSAADAAAVGSVAKNSPGFIAAGSMTGDGSIAAGATDAGNIFDGNMTGVTGYTLNSRTPVVTKTGIKITSDIQFSADVPTMFLGIMGKSKVTVTGESKAAVSLPPYLDFYLMLDVSGSMGLPSTDNEQTRLAAINPDNIVAYPGGCTLACHFAVQNVCGDGGQRYPTNNYCLGYAVTRVSPTAYTNLVNQKSTKSVPKPVPGLPNSMVPGLPDSLTTGNPSSVPTSLPAVSSCPADGTDSCIQLRADAVGFAVNQLLAAANGNMKVPNQFRIGLYPFIRRLYAYFALTSSINGDPNNSSTINYAAANLASQLDTNTSSNLGSGGTHLDTAFSTMNTTITTVGDGSSTTSTQPFVFLVTDGAQDPQTKGINGGSWAGSNHATVIDPVAQCKPLKDRGIMIGVVYIPYQPIQNPNHSFAGDEDGFANANIPNIEPSLKACASSPSFYIKANTPADITNGLQTLLKQSLISAHITN